MLARHFLVWTLCGLRDAEHLGHFIVSKLSWFDNRAVDGALPASEAGSRLNYSLSRVN